MSKQRRRPNRADRTPRVTIGIPYYNQERFLAAAIQSCLDQDYDDFELLLVNNCSTDRSREIAGSFAGDRRVRLIDNPQNVGFAGSNNVILREARGELIVNMGSDDVNPRDRLRRQVAVFD